MLLELRDDFCMPSEPSAQAWHEGNDIHMDVNLQQIQHHQLAWQIPSVNIPLTVGDLMNVLLLATKWWVPAKRLALLMLRYWRWMFRMWEGKKEKHPNPGGPQSFHKVNTCLCLCLWACHVLSPTVPALQFPVSLSPRLQLSCCPAAYCPWWVGLISYFAGSVWHLQQSRRENTSTYHLYHKP